MLCAATHFQNSIESVYVKRALHISSLTCIIALTGASVRSIASASPLPQTKPGDGVFTPTITPVATIDKTGHPTSVEVRDSEPRLASSIIAGASTGDSYIIHFATGDAGGPCIYTGTGRYFINNGGTLTFQALATCGNLRRGYNYMVCNLDEALRCKQPPWWYFRDRTYKITADGIFIDHAAGIAWNNPSEARQQLQKTVEQIRAYDERIRAAIAPNTVHGRSISCREYHPEWKSYGVHEFLLTCMIQTACSGMPNVGSVRDGDTLDWNSDAGHYVQQQAKSSDFSNWVCWLRTQ